MSGLRKTEQVRRAHCHTHRHRAKSPHAKLDPSFMVIRGFHDVAFARSDAWRAPDAPVERRTGPATKQSPVMGWLRPAGARNDTSGSYRQSNKHPSPMATERIQKILTAAGHGSRRSCEELIRRRRVRVNGVTVELGARADPARDVIQFRRLVWKSVHFLGLGVAEAVSGNTSTRTRLPVSSTRLSEWRIRRASSQAWSVAEERCRTNRPLTFLPTRHTILRTPTLTACSRVFPLGVSPWGRPAHLPRRPIAGAALTVDDGAVAAVCARW